ncbi:MAG: hypothetical protein QOE92_1932 [Chloroflexota bacterium]|nr:hypothetical protein [Chloroflexota bacterium]
MATTRGRRTNPLRHRPQGWRLAIVGVNSAALALAFSTLSPAPAARAENPTFPTSVVDVSGTAGLAEGEEFVAANPFNPMDVIVGSNQWQPYSGNPGNVGVGPSGATDCAVFDSHDGGLTWTGQRLDNGGIGTVPIPPPVSSIPNPIGSQFEDFGNVISADQSIVFDHHGNAYYQCIYLGLSNADPQVWVFRSTDAGRTWGPKVVAFSEVGTQIQIDRPFLAVDNSGGPRDGALYLAYETMFYQAYLPEVYVERSDDQGATWSSPVRVDEDANRAQWDPREFPQVGADGTLHVLYDASPLTSPCPCDPSTPALVVASSEDGGATFRHSTVDPEVHRISSQDEAFNYFQELVAAFAASPADPNRLAVAWPDAGSGEDRILLRQSLDGGRTWQDAADATDDPPGGGNQHDHATLAYLPDGALAIAWRDRRASGGSLTSPFEVFLRLAVPAGDGLAFGDTVRLTDAVQAPTTGHHGNMPTEYMSIAGDSTGIHASWDQLDASVAFPDNVYRHVATADLPRPTTPTATPGEADIPLPNTVPAAPAWAAGIMLGGLAAALVAGGRRRRRAGSRPEAYSASIARSR